MADEREIEDLKRRLASAERKAAELQAIVESVGDAIYIGGSDGITMSNQAALDQLGFHSQEELLRNIGTLAEEIQTRDAQTNEPISLEQQVFARALSGEKCVQEVRVRHRLTGEERIVRSSAAPVIMNGRVVAAVALNTDITDQKRIEAAIRESEQKYRALFNSMEEGFCVLEVVFDQHQQPLDLRFVEANPAFERNSGLSNVKSRGVSEVIPGLETHWFEIYGAVAMTGEPRKFENEAKALGRWFEVNTFRIDPPELHRVAVLFTDITERRQREEELKRMNRDLEQFAYSASHDLQEPIRTVSIYAQLLATGSTDRFTPEMTEWLQYVLSGARRMDRLVRDLLTYSQITTLDSAPTEIDANESLDAALSILEATIQENGAEIITSPLPRVVIHSIYLQQLFQNLIGNAIKYRAAERTPVVKIEAEQEQHGWRFSVTDNGIGIESDYLKSIFGIFKRLHNEQRYPGTGIGLAICQRIIERNGGRIWAKSQFGHGSTFYFWLPA